MASFPALTGTEGKALSIQKKKKDYYWCLSLLKVQKINGTDSQLGEMSYLICATKKTFYLANGSAVQNYSQEHTQWH